MGRKEAGLPPLKCSVLRAVGALRQALDWDRVPPSISNETAEFIEALEKFENHLLKNKATSDFGYCARQREVYFDQSDIWYRL